MCKKVFFFFLFFFFFKHTLKGLIPGPRKPQDMNSFLSVIIKDLKKMETGINCFDASKKENFLLKAFAVMATGDYPGISSVACMTGQNGKTGCRMCKIQGIYVKEKRHYYFPHTSRKINTNEVEKMKRSHRDFTNISSLNNPTETGLKCQ